MKCYKNEGKVYLYANCNSVKLKMLTFGYKQLMKNEL